MTTTPSLHARAEARFARQHSGHPPKPTPALRPLWHDIAAGAFLFLFLAILAVMT